MQKSKEQRAQRRQERAERHQQIHQASTKNPGSMIQTSDGTSVDRVRMSKRISFLLRHHPEASNLQVDRQGYVDVQELLEKAIPNHPLTIEELKDLMDHMDKPRFSFSEDGMKIRANHGHSVEVDLDLKDEIPPDLLWHGTADRFVSSIDEKGLLPMSRIYVHLSPEKQMAEEVGRRHGKLFLYQVDAKAMYQDGFRFYHTADNVWLVSHVPTKYLIKP